MMGPEMLVGLVGDFFIWLVAERVEARRKPLRNPSSPRPVRTKQRRSAERLRSRERRARLSKRESAKCDARGRPRNA